jgi:hypothetical protein
MTVNDTFMVDFSCTSHYLFVITEQSMKMLHFTTPLFESRGGLKKLPYTGAFTNHHLSILLD